MSMVIAYCVGPNGEFSPRPYAYNWPCAANVPRFASRLSSELFPGALVLSRSGLSLEKAHDKYGGGMLLGGQGLFEAALELDMVGRIMVFVAGTPVTRAEDTRYWRPTFPGFKIVDTMPTKLGTLHTLAKK